MHFHLTTPAAPSFNPRPRAGGDPIRLKRRIDKASFNPRALCSVNKRGNRQEVSDDESESNDFGHNAGRYGPASAGLLDR